MKHRHHPESRRRDPLVRRLPRELRADLAKYIVLFLFLTLMIGFVSGFLVADGSMIKAYRGSFEKFDVENGHFCVDLKLTKKAIENIEKEDVRLYELFYKDKDFGGKTVRVYQIREDVNRADLMEGRLPERSGEIVIDRLFAENNGIVPGDTMRIDGVDMKVTGTVALSDYSTMFKNNSDMMFDASDFSIAMVTREQFRAFDNSGLVYCYAWRYEDQSMTDDEQRQRAEDLMSVVYENSLLGADTSAGPALWNMILAESPFADAEDAQIEQTDAPLTDFVSRQENQAITFSGEDMGSDKVMFQWFLYIITAVLAFAFAITTRNTIEAEAGTIGTLMASGYTRRELLIHYITLPTAVTLAAAIAGNILGYTALKYIMMGMYYHSYSLPTYVTVWSTEAFLKTTLIPCALIVLVNVLIIGKALSLPPLQFLRRDLKRKKQTRAAKLPDLPFRSRFYLRVILQNRSTYVLLFVGLFCASLIFLFGTLFSPLLDNFRQLVKESEFCAYQYVLKDQAETDSERAEKYGICTLENEASGEKISVYGIQPDSRYVDVKQLSGAKGDQVVLSDGFMEKYGLEEGDTIRLKEEFKSRTYTFRVAGTYEYPASLAVFMTLDQFNRTFDLEEDYFSGYFSDEKLDDIRDRDIATLITEQDLTVMADQLEDSMGRIFNMFLGFAVILFILLIYLLAKLITERNAHAISMLKILGFTDREAGSLYNSATFLVVAASMVLSGFLGMLALRVIYYTMMKGFTGWLTFYAAPWGVPLLVAGGIACYGLVNIVLMRRIRKIPMADALKNIE